MKYLSILFLSILLFVSGCEDRGYGNQDIDSVPFLASNDNMTIIESTPDGNISKSSYINIKFSSFINLDTVTPQNITLTKEGSSNTVLLDNFEAIDSSLHIKPLEVLEVNQTYILKIESSIKDIFGNFLDKAYSINFECVEDFWQSVEAGETHSMALSKDGDLYAWGSNSYKELLIGDGIVRSIPIGITNTKETIDFSAGSYNSAIVNKSHHIVTIGNNILSENTHNDINKTSIGNKHGVIIKLDGTLWSWGKNRNGQLGNLGITESSELVQEYSKSIDWIEVSAGEDYTIALKSDNTMWGWGDNEYGQIGNTRLNERRQPVQEDTNATNWTSISAGANHSSAIKDDGSLWSWGLNVSGQLGNGTTSSSRVAVRENTNTTWIDVSAGENHTLALKSNGELWAWGSDYYGQLGDSNGISEDKNSPVQIDGNWTSVSAGKNFSLATKSDGTLWAWGYNAQKQLGLGSNTGDVNIPTEVGVK